MKTWILCGALGGALLAGGGLMLATIGAVAGAVAGARYGGKDK
jgi:hypothetical protein